MATSTGPTSSADFLNTFVPHVLGINYVDKTNPIEVPDTRPSAPKDAVVIVNFTDWEISALKLSLTNAGITTFAQFQNLRPSHFQGMDYTDHSGTVIKLPVYNAAQGTWVVAFYHYLRANLYEDDDDLLTADFLNDCAQTFADFHALDYDPEAPIIPYRRIRERGTDEDRRAIDTWNKNIKLSPKDFPVFKEAIYWNKFKRMYMVAMESANLKHLTQVTHKPKCVPLHKAQCGWVYKMQQDNFQEPYAKSIVIQYIDTKDVARIWFTICEYHDSSMTNSLRVATVSSYITSTRLHKQDFRGKLGTWILNFVEQVRLHNDMVSHKDDEISSGQAVNFLEAAVSGVEGLNTVRYSWQAAQKGSGRTGARLDLPEYTELLLAQAAVIDSSKGRTTNSRYRANMTEYTFDQDDDAIEPDDDGVYDVANHDFDIESSPEYMTFLTERGKIKKKAWMDKESWQSLSSSGKETWDKLSDSDKAIIKSSHQKSSGGTQRKTFPPRKTFANNHEQDTPANDEKSNDQDTGSVLQVGAHEINPVIEANTFERKTTDAPSEQQEEPMKKEQDILSLMAQKADARNATKSTSTTGEADISINNIMSQPSKNTKMVKGRGIPYEHQRKVGFHEVDMTGRSDETPTGTYNCWIVEANYTPEDHKEPARSLQANTMHSETAHPYDANTDSSIPNSGSNDTIPSKETRSSDDTWELDDQAGGTSPQEAALLEELQETQAEDDRKPPAEEIQMPEAPVAPTENSPDSQDTRHSTTLADIHQEPIDPQPSLKQGVDNLGSWLNTMPQEARLYTYQRLFEQMQRDGFNVPSTALTPDSHQTATTPTTVVESQQPDPTTSQMTQTKTVSDDKSQEVNPDEQASQGKQAESTQVMENQPKDQKASSPTTTVPEPADTAPPEPAVTTPIETTTTGPFDTPQDQPKDPDPKEQQTVTRTETNQGDEDTPTGTQHSLPASDDPIASIPAPNLPNARFLATLLGGTVPSKPIVTITHPEKMGIALTKPPSDGPGVVIEPPLVDRIPPPDASLLSRKIHTNHNYGANPGHPTSGSVYPRQSHGTKKNTRVSFYESKGTASRPAALGITSTDGSASRTKFVREGQGLRVGFHEGTKPPNDAGNIADMKVAPFPLPIPEAGDTAKDRHLRRRAVAAAARAKKDQDTTVQTNLRPDPNERLLATKESREATKKYQAKLQAVPKQQHRDLIFKPKKDARKPAPANSLPTKILTTSGKKLGMGVGIPPEALNAYKEAQRKVADGEWVAATPEEETKTDEDYIDPDDPLDSPERPDLTHVPDHQLNPEERKQRARNRKKRQKRKAKEAAMKAAKQGSNPITNLVSNVCELVSPLSKYNEAKVDSSPENSPHGTPDRVKEGEGDVESQMTNEAHQQNANFAEAVLEDPGKKAATIAKYSQGNVTEQDFHKAGDY